MRCARSRLGCGARFTLARAPWKYARAVRCPNCKSIHVDDVEKHAAAQTKRRKARGLIHTCWSIPFPHVRGTVRFCSEHPKIRRQATRREERAHMDMLKTPRGRYFG